MNCSGCGGPQRLDEIADRSGEHIVAVADDHVGGTGNAHVRGVRYTMLKFFNCGFGYNVAVLAADQQRRHADAACGFEQMPLLAFAIGGNAFEQARIPVPAQAAIAAIGKQRAQAIG